VVKTRKRLKMNTESNGISIQNMCYGCQALSELCPDCQEQRDARDSEIAHQIVDEGNLQYKFVWSQTQSDITGHDWIGSVTRLSRPAILGDGTVVEERYEFLDPISLLTDRIYDLESSVTITPAEVLCQDCHLVYNKYAKCPNCN
jgi:hypothetical protein